MLEESQPVEYFEFIGGRPCLDFSNTLSDRFRETPIEVLTTYDDFLTWSQLAGIVDADRVRQLRVRAELEPAQAARWLLEIRQARAVLTNLLSDVAAGRVSCGEDLDRFNQLLAETLIHLGLAPGEHGFAWHWNSEYQAEKLPLWIIVRDAANLLTSSETGHVHMCVSDTCDWLFLDTSKNHSRRWCDMKVCGNRAKARRYYDRQKLLL